MRSAGGYCRERVIQLQWEYSQEGKYIAAHRGERYRKDKGIKGLESSLLSA